jgi:hypothetical protein
VQAYLEVLSFFLAGPHSSCSVAPQSAPRQEVSGPTSGGVLAVRQAEERRRLQHVVVVTL